MIGPMIQERWQTDAGYTGLVATNALGFWLGYVVVPESIELDGLDDRVYATGYEDNELTMCGVHGGLEGARVVGFDHAHAWDKPMPALVQDTSHKRAAETYFNYPDARTYDLDYVKREVEKLAAAVAQTTQSKED